MLLFYNFLLPMRLLFGIYLSFSLLIRTLHAQDEVDDTATMSPFSKPGATQVSDMQSKIDDSVGFVFGIPCSNRTEWDTRKLAFTYSGYKTSGERFLGTPQPPWSDAAYLDYYTSKNRKLGQDMMINRLDRLYPLALAECYYWNGTFANQLNQELLSIVNQKTWVWPAHGI